LDELTSTEVGLTVSVPVPSFELDTVTVGELARLVRVPDEVDFSWVVKVDVPALEGPAPTRPRPGPVGDREGRAGGQGDTRDRYDWPAAETVPVDAVV